SSMRPLQLSSLPLQVSAGGTVLATMPRIAALAALASASDTVMAAPVPPATAMRLLAARSAAGRPLSVTTYVLTSDRRNIWQACTTGWNGFGATPPAHVVRSKLESGATASSQVSPPS